MEEEEGFFKGIRIPLVNNRFFFPFFFFLFFLLVFIIVRFG